MLQPVAVQVELGGTGGLCEALQKDILATWYLIISDANGDGVISDDEKVSSLRTCKQTPEQV